ncbi:hypothetical protein LEP1GSC132_0346 [Leptospira kirschneri str. 200803703]|uniref:Uncharacterized protein n=2 Tax=Leptospira kirschneri TaxID=29507 RepID=A0A828YAP0_9LEPT|nr:hypothetical protein LEP1GSC131_0422 [Leptospira kirschneri str. 200802841]EKO62737.1 hypothetical protein LEP1GSC082_0295 [Leptospira kirschneri str. H2]EKP03321.1 hypothetical protein LEP1GSC018_3359 [Leptospira kirschneri str. 2008720114]EMK25181.1 hypothetical protein LEP1GSC008_4446 [Leptospira kirschneri serovar Bulgarica str. Nikolaevo]EMN24269.1 hypothetical protein LEP1GSC065_1576 [Leptospira kirschneri serovar Sokoine str. RM1]EMO68708.1 hypothetical protein LEP1GSC132_0346 [Lepto
MDLPVVPTFKESIYKAQIPTFSELWFSYIELILNNASFA